MASDSIVEVGKSYLFRFAGEGAVKSKVVSLGPNGWVRVERERAVGIAHLSGSLWLNTDLAIEVKEA